MAQLILRIDSSSCFAGFMRGGVKHSRSHARNALGPALLMPRHTGRSGPGLGRHFLQSPRGATAPRRGAAGTAGLTVTPVSCNVRYMSTRRAELIDRCLRYFLKHGAAGISLRPLAAATGTSARLLVYHFGSKDRLIGAVMDEVRSRLQRSFSDLAASSRRGRRQSPMQAFWSWAIRAENAPYLRLLFEVQILAIQDPGRYARYLEGTSTSWLDLIERSLPPSQDRRAVATLCAAVMDGLLLEYLSTGQVKRTTRALALFDRMVARSPWGRGERRDA